MTKKIADLTDEELQNISDEDLAAMAEAEEAVAAGGGGEEGGEEEGEEGEGEEGEGEEGEEGLTPEQIAALATGAEEEEEEEEDGAAGDMVPRSRLNGVLRRNADLTAILRHVVTLPGGQQQAPRQEEQQADPDPQPEFDFTAERKKLTKLISENADEADIDAQMQRIDDARDALTEWKVRQAAATATHNALKVVTANETARAVQTVERDLGQKFTFLDSNSKDAFEPAILAVNAKAKQLIAKGVAPAEALLKAGESIGKQFAKVLKIPAKAAGKDGKPLPLNGQDVRSKEAMKRNLGIRQPGTTKAGVGNREQLATLDINQLTDEQIEKLEKTDPAALAKLLGNDRIPT